MTATLHLGVRDAVQAALAGILPADRIHGNRNYPLDQAVESQIDVYRLSSSPERNLLGALAPIDWTTVLRIVVKARAASDGSASAEAIADSLIAACYAAVMANQTLGGLAQLLDPGDIAWDQDEADTQVVMAMWEFRVVHRTETNTIT